MRALRGGAAVLAYGLLCGPTLAGWATDAWRDPNYGHVLPLSALLLGLGLWRLRRGEGTKPGSGVVALLLGLGTLSTLLGILGAESFTRRAGCVLLALGGLGLLAPARAGALRAALLAHLLLIPWPYVLFYGLTARLQRISSAAAELMLRGSGVPVARDGNLLRLTGYQLEVVEACSGLRSLLTLTALAATLAVLSRAGLRRSLLLLGAAVPLALGVNLLRLLLTGWAAQLAGPESAETVFHLGGGLLSFTLGSLLLGAVAFLGRGERR